MSKSSAHSVIRLRGVRHNNLKNFDLDLPLNQLIVITGLSGSGKSSLAFDTLFAEGQRRYIETFSPYARQFFDRMDKPQVDSIEGIPPAIAIEQRNAVKSTRSTVGTMTEICDHMKVLWPHIAQLHCKQCGQIVRQDSPQTIFETLASVGRVSSRADQPEENGSSGASPHREVLITFDLPLSEKLSLEESLALISKQGYQRILLDNEIVRLEEVASRLTPHVSRLTSLTVLQDRVKLAAASRARFVEACEQAYHFGKGKLTIHEPDHPHPASRIPHRFSNRLHCATCDLEYREPSPALFSFNHPVGACPACKGFGRTVTIDYDLAIPDRSLTLAQGAVRPWRSGFSAECQGDMTKFCKRRRVPMNVAFAELSSEQQRWVIEGDQDYGKDKEHEWPRAWYGVRGYFKWLETKSYKMHVRVLLSRYRAYTTCPECKGTRFQPEALLYRLSVGDDVRSLNLKSKGRKQNEEKLDPPHVVSYDNLTLAGFYALPIRDALRLVEEFVATQQLRPSDPIGLVFQEVRSRLNYLNEVGLGYLTLDRPTRSLSGGETERVNLTTCLGTRLVNTLFVLDEPSVGLHPHDTERLVRILEKLRDTGNTVVVVEHEAAVMRAANQIVDLGPGHGATGGQIVFQGTYPEILKSKESLTGKYLSGRKQIEIPNRRHVGQASRLSVTSSAFEYGDRRDACPTLKIENATRHNLKNLSVEIPLGRFVCLTGVSGSGKTTLVREVLLPALEAKLKSRTSNSKLPVTKASDRIEAAPASDFGVASEDEKENEDAIAQVTHHASPITGCEHLGRVVLVDQSALGKTPRSNPAVYIGAFEDIREFFAQSEPAKQRGLNASAFSFNSAQGQCERCRGAGFEKIEMQFLSDVFIRCPDCDGRRYRAHILEVKVSGARDQVSGQRGARHLTPDTSHPAPAWSIADMLDATVDEAIDFLSAFAESRPAQRAVGSLKLLQEVGLGYLRLGQPINTLSGGESQRLKLVSHLAEANQRRTGVTPVSNSKRAHEKEDGDRRDACPALFLFDEPTTGLHFDDVRVLLKVFQRLVAAGHSVIVIEHNLDVIKSADWIIDLGPDAGDEGGKVVAQGTPEEVARCEASHTGRFLRSLVDANASSPQPSLRVKAQEINRTFASDETISIHGAREHNLKNLSLEIPRDKFVVITGVSGSGKSTLAFDLLFAEGQRRFLDSMNVYARQFVEQPARPDVDLITGIPPTVSIEQRNSRGGGKSTVATVTEIYHFVRLLFARLGTQFCPDCEIPVEAQTRDSLGRRLQVELKKRGDLLLLAPVVKNRKGFHTDVAEWAAKHGYAELRADGKMYSTREPFRLDRFGEHDVEIVVGVLDKGRVGALRRPRGVQPRNRPLNASGDAAARRPYHEIIDETLKLGHGTLLALDNHGKISIHSTERSCPDCGRSFEPLDPKNFSYNSSQGWCPKCRGFGELFYLPDVERGANADAVEESWYGWAQERELCPECHGARLNPVARAVRLNVGQASSLSPSLKARKVRDRLEACPTIDDFSAFSVAAAFELFRKFKFTGRAATIARDILPEIRERLKFLNEVGLGYLQLGRGVPTLSGGEAQRIRLAAQLGSNLSGVLYVLDEPTIGLHARDNEQLLATLQKLKSRGNSVVVVEHDEETMRRADYIIDLGPGAGVHGGEVVAAGTLPELFRHPESVTGKFLRAQTGKHYPARGLRRPVNVGQASSLSLSSNRRKIRDRLEACPSLTLTGANLNNLKNLTVNFPLGRLVCVTGVSGSGKSTLIRECLLPAVAEALKVGRGSRRANADSRGRPPHLTGFESLKAVYEVDQSPIGRTPRSIPATYVGFFDEIRQLFAQLPEARMRGYSASRFSFNSTQGRCPQCEGAGQIKLEMNFLPPAFVRCEVCGGTRFNRETLDVEYGGKNIAQVLDLSVEEALDFFASVPKIRRALQALHDTGLDYLKLGQTSPTLSGGEAQRVKLVSHLLSGLRPAPDQITSRLTPHASRSSNLFILEEPTIGLHMADVRRLVEVLQRLVDAGHSVIVIEHNLDLIAEADWVIDLGPEGGGGGGRIVAEGTPEQVALNKRSHTGKFLRSVLCKA
jgi:excinuclease ABC subunit A